MWYNNTVSSVVISRAEIQYMDGTQETIQGSDIPIVAQTASSGCCYVATAVYGTYDCPKVWTLRRFRDYDLAETWYGRAFVHIFLLLCSTRTLRPRKDGANAGMNRHAHSI